MKLPRYELMAVEDYYTYYVELLGISEDVFWNRDIAFVAGVARNKSAYDKFMQKMRDMSKR